MVNNVELHQFLRYIQDAVPIILFNLNGDMLLSVRDKSDIDIDLYSEIVFEISLGKSNIPGCSHAIYITLQK